MATLIVGIADCKVSADPANELVTYALGSCIGIAVYDPAAKVAGLLHILLPDSNLDLEKARRKPFTFADTGIPLLLREVMTLGARRERLVTRIAGGSQMSLTGGVLNVGPKNIRAVRRILSGEKLPIQSDSTGGHAARTLHLKVATGEVILQQLNTDYKQLLKLSMPHAAR